MVLATTVAASPSQATTTSPIASQSLHAGQAFIGEGPKRRAEYFAMHSPTGRETS
ncbi:hypothetical protein Droror1_Dr00008369, partial [Drosera rotundifolia]